METIEFNIPEQKYPSQEEQMRILRDIQNSYPRPRILSRWEKLKKFFKVS